MDKCEWAHRFVWVCVWSAWRRSTESQMRNEQSTREIETQNGPIYAAGEYATCPRINQYMTCFALVFCVCAGCFCRYCQAEVLHAATYSLCSLCTVAYGVHEYVYVCVSLSLSPFSPACFTFVFCISTATTILWLSRVKHRCSFYFILY